MTFPRLLIVLALLLVVLACGAGDAGLKGYAEPVRPTPQPLVGVAQQVSP